jgi:hypothetical protein
MKLLVDWHILKWAVFLRQSPFMLHKENSIIALKHRYASLFFQAFCVTLLYISSTSTKASSDKLFGFGYNRTFDTYPITMSVESLLHEMDMEYRAYVAYLVGALQRDLARIK